MPALQGLKFRAVNRQRSTRRFPDDHPAVTGLHQVQCLAAGDVQCVRVVRLLEFGAGFAAIDGHRQVAQLDADARLAHDAATAVLFPCFSVNAAWRVKLFAIAAQIAGHVFG